MTRSTDLAVIETHPIQYHAPVYRSLQQRCGIKVTAIYGSDFSVAGYCDEEFGATFKWDTDLLSGYNPVFLSTVANDGAHFASQVSARGLAETLRQVNPTAVLLVGYSPRFHRQAFFRARRLGYPLLFRGETTDHAHHRGVVKRFLRDSFLRWFYRQFSALLYVGQRSFQHYRCLGVSEDRLYSSPYCVDTAAFQLTAQKRTELRSATRRELNLCDSHLVLLFSGKLVPRKAPDLLLQAAKCLPSITRDRIAILFLGDGELARDLDTWAHTEPEVAVRLAGFQNQQALSRYYCAADILVLPSQKHETWGLVVNEALHHGIPCIVSDQVGCVPDLIEPRTTGEIFQAGSVEGLRQAIERATELVGRPQVCEWCRHKVSGYTVEKAADGIAQAYWAVVENRT